MKTNSRSFELRAPPARLRNDSELIGLAGGLLFCPQFRWLVDPSGINLNYGDTVVVILRKTRRRKSDIPLQLKNVGLTGVPSIGWRRLSNIPSMPFDCLSTVVERQLLSDRRFMLLLKGTNRFNKKSIRFYLSYEKVRI